MRGVRQQRQRARQDAEGGLGRDKGEVEPDADGVRPAEPVPAMAVVVVHRVTVRHHCLVPRPVQWTLTPLGLWLRAQRTDSGQTVQRLARPVKAGSGPGLRR